MSDIGRKLFALKHRYIRQDQLNYTACQLVDNFAHDIYTTYKFN